MSKAFSLLFGPEVSGSIRGNGQPIWIKPDQLWPMEERRHSYELLVSLFKAKIILENFKIKEALTALLESVIWFNAKYNVKHEVYKIMAVFGSKGPNL